MSAAESDNLLEMWAEQTDPVKWAALQIVKGGRECKTSGEAMDMIEATIAKAIELRLREHPAESPHWPDGLEQYTHYEFPCDDKGRDGGCWLRVLVAGDGDVHVSMQEWEDIRQEGTHPCPVPSVRCRTGIGGGRFRRTHQALLLLADAIRRDTEDLGATFPQTSSEE